MRSLLDVSVLLALLDADHVDHLRVQQTAAQWLSDGWASCPITQNGFVRIISQPRYPSPVTTPQAVGQLAAAAAHTSHEFWPDDLSLLDPDVLDGAALLGPRQITDAYLLALAVRRDGQLVTLDRAISLAAIPGATAAHLTVL
ncbi:type II toxin-antitoxin system VapC family toxin [soil metagenome]